jgi:hypothetical protein
LTKYVRNVGNNSTYYPKGFYLGSSARENKSSPVELRITEGLLRGTRPILMEVLTIEYINLFSKGPSGPVNFFGSGVYGQR